MVKTQKGAHSSSVVRNMNETSRDELIAVHICQSCETATERAAVNAESMISGLVRCPACGHEGPLNIEIRDRKAPTKRPPMRATDPSGAD